MAAVAARADAPPEALADQSESRQAYFGKTREPIHESEATISR